MKSFTRVTSLLIAAGLILTGCGAQQGSQSHRSSNQSASRSASMPHQTDVQHDLHNNQDGAQQKRYSTPKQAKQGLQHQINQHLQVSQAAAQSSQTSHYDPFAVDLGYHIVGHQDRGAGQTYVGFKMGRWQIVVHGNSVNETSSSAVKYAKQLVSYLQTHTLPIPSSRGAMQIDLNSDSARMSWDHAHQVNSLRGKPKVILQKAVALK